MHVDRQVTLDASGLRIGIAVSRYHEEITRALCAGAVEAFTAAGGAESDLVIAHAPGSFELTVVSRALAARDDVDGVVALGCIIRGETAHDQYLCEAVSGGLTQICCATGKPVAFGVLTCNTKHQARERSGGERGNKGTEAMNAVVETVRTVRAIARPGSPGTHGRRG